MNREKGLIKFILTDRHYSIADKIEYFLYRISGIIYASIFLFLVYEKFMHRIATNWFGFLALISSPTVLFVVWGRRIVIKFIEPYKHRENN